MRPLTTLTVWAVLLAFSGAFWASCLSLAVPECDALFFTGGRTQAELAAEDRPGDLIFYDETTACWGID